VYAEAAVVSAGRPPDAGPPGRSARGRAANELAGTEEHLGAANVLDELGRVLRAEGDLDPIVARIAAMTLW
jgi:hypothetical protein